MDWTQTLTTIGIFSAFFVYVIGKLNDLSKSSAVMETELKSTNQRIDDFKYTVEQKFNNTNQRIDDFKHTVEQKFNDTNQRITDLKQDTNQRLITIEGYLVPKKIFHLEAPPPDEPKEN